MKKYTDLETGNTRINYIGAESIVMKELTHSEALKIAIESGRPFTYELINNG